MELNQKSIIGEIVANDFRTATVFKKYAIDFCCNGNRDIEEVTEAQGINSVSLLRDLTIAMNDSSTETSDFNQWPLDLLAEFIEKKHHKYCETKISEIKPYLEKIANVHGIRHPELKQIKELFDETGAKMSVHMKKEELLIFPFIKKMIKLKENGEKLPASRLGTDNSPIELMKEDHNEEGERFRKIRELSKDYFVPEDACSTYKVSLALLKEFEEDLHQHIHLENNILFPKAIELEKELI